MFFVALQTVPSHLAQTIAALSPNHAVILATIGLCLIFLECNRPGRILPGALGLALLLLATASLLHHPLQPAALSLLLLASATLAANLWKDLSVWLAVPVSAALTFGLRFLIPESVNPHINTATSLTCGLAIGLLGTFLSRVALRARRLKAVH